MKKRHSIAISLLTVAALAITGCSGDSRTLGKVDPQTRTAGDAVAQTVDGTVQQAMQLTKSTQAVVGVWLPGGKAHVRGYGEGVNANTAIRAAQTTAPMACAALLQATRNGTVKLDAKIAGDLKQQPRLRDVTYRQLCEGTSGFANPTGALLPIANGNPSRPWPETEIFAQSLVHKPLPHAGKNRYLSDADPVILTRLLRNKTEQTTEEMFTNTVFSAANMQASYYPEARDNHLPQNALKPLRYVGSGKDAQCQAGAKELGDVSGSVLAGAGATVTTVTDLRNFYTAFFEGKFGGKALLDGVNKPVSLANPERKDDGSVTAEPKPVPAGEVPYSEIAFGTEKIGPLYGRAGELPGTISAAYTDPATKFTVVIALNNSTSGAVAAQDAALLLAAQLAQTSGVAVPWTADAAAKRLASRAVCQ